MKYLLFQGKKLQTSIFKTIKNHRQSAMIVIRSTFISSAQLLKCKGWSRKGFDQSLLAQLDYNILERQFKNRVEFIQVFCITTINEDVKHDSNLLVA